MLKWDKKPPLYAIKIHMNVVLITAILSTMLAAMFALGRMMRSLSDEHMAPKWLRDKGDVPYRGILCSGAAMCCRTGLLWCPYCPDQFRDNTALP